MDNTDEKTEEQLSLTIEDISASVNDKTAAKDKHREQNPKQPASSKTAPRTADKSVFDQLKKRSIDPKNMNNAPSRENKTVNKVSSDLKPSVGINTEKKRLSDMEVMEHTASVWQYKEIVDNGTETHSEYHEKHTETAFGEIIGARVRGKKHKHEGTNCDDYFETAITDDCLICVVCDGAGSKPLSRIGSRVSAETAAAFLKKSLSAEFKNNENVKKGLCAELGSAEFMSSCEKLAPVVQQSAREAFAAQQKALDEVSDNDKYLNALGRKPALNDFSTTFLAAVCVPLIIDNKHQTLMICVQIGDGCICAVDSKANSESCLKIMGKADSGAFSGETDFLSEKNIKPEAIAARTRISRGNSDTIMLMSDGVADDYFPAQPMMKRLYLDLCLNGIIPMSGELSAAEDPAPIRFKSVSLSQSSVALQYSKQLLSGDSEESVNALWDKREALRCHSLEAFRTNIGDTPQQRLRVWLDNYNERGSFDDRTLTIIKLIMNN